MGPNAKIIVAAGTSTKDGGYLKLDNSVVTSDRACGNDNQMWQGVEVHGNTTKYQQVGNHPPAAEWQGTIEVQNASEISYAKTGILTCDPASPYTTSGGVIVAGNSNFLNNSVGVSIQQYLPPAYGGPLNNSIIDAYRANFIGCTFNITDALATPFTTHLYGKLVKGVSVRGCRFYNSFSHGGGTGIGGYDFGVKVDQYATSGPGTPTTFNGLDNGVKIGAIIDGSYPYSVRHSNFSAKQYGIYSSGVELPIITDNSFTITAPNMLIGSVGTAIVAGTNYMITRNAYTGTGSGQTAGTVIDYGGSYTSNVFVNNYGSLRTGNLSNHLNQGLNAQNNNIGLQFLCNAYDKNTFAEAARGTDPNNHGMNRNQGSQSISAGNTFTNNTTGIYNPSTEVVPITYWYDNGINKFPGAIVGNANPGQSSLANDCDYSKDTGPLGGNGGYINPGSPGPIKGLRIIHNIGYSLSGPNGGTNKDSAIYWLTQLQSPYGDLGRTDLMIEDGNFADANILYNSITATYSMPTEESTEFTVWGRKLMNVRIALQTAGLHLEEMSAAQADSVKDVALHGHMWAQARAQNWMNLYNGSTYETAFLFPESADGKERKAHVTAAETGYKVYPNPVSEYLSVAYTNTSDKGAVMQITDVVGRVISQAVLQGRSGEVKLDVRNLQNGIYLYRITENGKTMQIGKVTKQ